MMNAIKLFVLCLLLAPFSVQSQENEVNVQFTDGFDYPVGKPDATGYYNAQKFTENNHLGDDWNGVGGGNTDLGDPIYSIAHGYVSFAENIGGGWGNVIRIVHTINENEQVESLYAHCDDVDVNEGDDVEKGQKIGTIGNNNGQYLAHLHLELRSEVGLPIGGGYSSNTSGYLDPTDFIQQNRR
jgi:murein DD-endopeptidase MepM/ murein hydrolase activator NlpD